MQKCSLFSKLVLILQQKSPSFYVPWDMSITFLLFSLLIYSHRILSINIVTLVLSYFRRALSIISDHLIVNYYIFIYIVGCLLLIVYWRCLFYVFLLPVNVLLMFQYLSNISIILLIWINNIGNENSLFFKS